MIRKSWGWMTRPSRRQELLIVLLFFLAALFVRVYQLDTIPPGLYNDEAANGVDVLEILRGHQSIFFERNFGRESLFIYLQAAVVALLGATPFALRVTAAVVGALVVPAAYWLAREAFARTDLNARHVAMWTAFFMTFDYWHISINRIGFRANLLPLVATIAFAFFWRAWNRLEEGKGLAWGTFTLAGFFLGLCVYTYTAGRFLPFLVVIVALVSLLRRGQSSALRWQKVLSVALIGVVSVIVFAPLAFYFWQHPDSFYQRALSVSVFSQGSTGWDALRAFVESAAKTIGMFLFLHDPNIRHDPAFRPIFEFWIGIWLIAGVILCLRRWRTLPYLFVASWVVLLALSAILTVEGIPHSLRATGMIPAAYIVPVLAMLIFGRWLSTKGARFLPTRLVPRGLPLQWVAIWLPLPFLLLSGAKGTYDYFSAFRDPERFSGAFFTHYVSLAESLMAYDHAGDSWLITLSPNHFPYQTEVYTVEFLYRGASKIISISANTGSAAQVLSERLQGSKHAYLLRPELTEDFPDAVYVLGDAKNLVKFLLDKYAVLKEKVDASVVSMPFLVYELPPSPHFELFGKLAPFNVSFAHQFRLIGADYGRTVGQDKASEVDVSSHEVEAGGSLWAVLQFVADVPIEPDLKSSLYVIDQFGHRVGQSDELLKGNRYPLNLTWFEGEETNLYHILPILPATPPGSYELYLHIYEDQTLLPYPLVSDNTTIVQRGGDLFLGTVEVVKPTAATAEVMPQVPVANMQNFGDELALLGYDALPTVASPGLTLPLTFYWQALKAPAKAYDLTIQLRTNDGDVILAEATDSPARQQYPTNEWSAQEIVRDWHDILLPSTLENGTYQLVMTVAEGDSSLGEVALGEISVEGRALNFEPLPVESPISAKFGEYVQLLGVADTLPQTLAAGGELEMCLVWQPLMPAPEEMVRFVHLLDEDGQVIVQQDGAPCEGGCPPTSWVEDEILCDNVKLSLPAELPQGNYRLAVGWYSPVTLSRLPAVDERGKRLQDELLILPTPMVVP